MPIGGRGGNGLGSFDGKPEKVVRREIWFLKWGTSYLPIHWKGFVVMALVIVPILAVTVAGWIVLEHLGHGDFDGLLLIIMICIGLMILFPIAKRHS